MFITGSGSVTGDSKTAPQSLLSSLEILVKNVSGIVKRELLDRGNFTWLSQLQGAKKPVGMLLKSYKAQDTPYPKREPSGPKWQDGKVDKPCPLRNAYFSK